MLSAQSDMDHSDIDEKSLKHKNSELSLKQKVERSKKSENKSQNNMTGGSTSLSSISENQDDQMTFEPLQLVWAKCRGYPWYPALTIDPEMPKGYVYNGVPLPTPPSDVLGLRKDKSETVFLVLFFDAKRTWQWLPSNKLELLNVDEKFDKTKLTESRKQSKAVKKAYTDAIKFHAQVTDLENQGPGAIM